MTLKCSRRFFSLERGDFITIERGNSLETDSTVLSIEDVHKDASAKRSGVRSHFSSNGALTINCTFTENKKKVDL